MAISLAQTTPITCSSCQTAFNAEVWFVLYAVERPELIAQAREGALHRSACPHCGHENELDAPLLLCRPGEVPPLVFCPAEGTTVEQDREVAGELLGWLRGALGEEWQDAWFEALAMVPRRALNAALTGNAQPGGLQRATLAFVQARTWAESLAVVEANAELLSPAGVALLTALREQARANGQTEIAAMFEEHRALLERCLSVGVRPAFAEIMRTLPGAAAATALPPALRAEVEQATAAEAQYRRSGDRRGLNDAITAWERALSSPDFRVAPLQQRMIVLNDAGGAYLRRSWANGSLHDLGRALDLWQEVITLTPEDSPNLPGFLNNLGTGLSTRYGRTGALSDLDRAVQTYERATELTPEDSPDLPEFLNNLGNGLRKRYVRTGAAADLDRAVRYYKRATELTPEDSPDLPSRLNNLGNGLSTRYARTGAVSDLDLAVRSYERATELTPEDSPDLPTILNNLGNGLSKRYARTGAKADLDRAVRFYERATELTPEDSSDLPSRFNDLGNGLSKRHERTGAVSDLDRAVRSYARARADTRGLPRPAYYPQQPGNSPSHALRSHRRRPRPRRTVLRPCDRARPRTLSRPAFFPKQPGKRPSHPLRMHRRCRRPRPRRAVL